MLKNDFIKGLILIGEIFNKQYSELETNIYYDLAKDYSKEQWNNAITKIIKTQKYAPKPVEIIKALQDNENAEWLDVIELMIKDGYFKRPDWNYKKYVAELEQLKQLERGVEEIEKVEEKIAKEITRMQSEELHAIEKAKMWVIQDTIPEWLLEDMRKYYQQKEKITYQDVKQLGGIYE